MSRTRIIGIIITIIAIVATSVAAYATMLNHAHPKSIIRYYGNKVIKIDILRVKTPIKSNNNNSILSTIKPGARFILHGLRVNILVNGTWIHIDHNSTLVLVIERVDPVHGVVIGKLEPLRELETLYEIIMKYIHR